MMDNKVMHKRQLVDEVARRSVPRGLPRRQVRDALHGILDVITDEMAEGNAVTIAGFGRFEAKEHRGRHVVDDILAENRRQLERLLDVYLAGDFPHEMLTDRKSRLEATIRSLERERSGLVDHLQAGNLTEGQIQTLRDFVAKVGAGIDVAEADFQTRRGVIEALTLPL